MSAVPTVPARGLVLSVLLLVAALVLGVTVAPASQAQDEEAFTLTVEPTSGLEATDTVTITLSGTPAGNGLYVRQCNAPVGEDRPTSCNGTGMWATLPAGSPALGGTFAPSEGTFELPVEQVYGEVDCTVVQCGIHTRRDHNDGSDTSLDRFVPITFAAGVPGGERAVRRLEGEDRFATAAGAAGSFTEATVAYVAAGDGFADALAGGPAAILEGAPVLLVGRDHLPAATRDALDALAPDRIVLLGGTAAISAAVESELGAIAPTERRVGPDRFATAAAVATASWPNPVTDVFIASGQDYPDALAGGAAAGAYGAPLLLVTRDGIPAPTRAEIERLDPQRITILGGEASVSAAVQQELNGIASTTRLSGADRFSTAATIAQALWSAGTRHAVVVTGNGFADALSAAALAGLQDGPVLLVTRDQAPQATLDVLSQLGVTDVTVLGGPGVVSDAVLTQLAGVADDGGGHDGAHDPAS